MPIVVAIGIILAPSLFTQSTYRVTDIGTSAFATASTATVVATVFVSTILSTTLVCGVTDIIGTTANTVAGVIWADAGTIGTVFVCSTRST